MRLYVVGLATLVVVHAPMAFADALGSAKRAKIFEKQTSVLDGRAAQQYSNSVRYQKSA